jgi:hypothetical protein
MQIFYVMKRVVEWAGTNSVTVPLLTKLTGTMKDYIQRRLPRIPELLGRKI